MKNIILTFAAAALLFNFYQCESSSPFEPSEDDPTGSIPDIRETEKFSTNINMSSEYYQESEDNISNATGFFSGAPLSGDLGGTMTAEIMADTINKDALVSNKHTGTGMIMLDDGQIFDITFSGSNNPRMSGTIEGTCQNGVLKLTGKYYEQRADGGRALIVIGQISYINGALPPGNDEREVT